MQKNIVELFNCYISNNTHKHPNIDNIDIGLFSYHKIDMIFYEWLIKCNCDISEQLIRKKGEIEYKNNKYIEIAKLISKELIDNGISHVFLKGIYCATNIYKQYWQRYFGDIDLLVEKKNIKKVENVLLKFGYIYAFESGDGILCPASRSDVLFQKTFTHEMHNMARIEENGWISNVDVNFLFSWNGLDTNNTISLLDFKEHIVYNNDLYFFDDIINYVHLCCHLYNEAVYFALDKNFFGNDPKEVRLDRIIDIAILSQRLTVSDFNIISNISIRYNLSEKICFSILLVDQLLKINIAKNIEGKLNYHKVDFAKYISRNKKVVKWPISIEERVFNLGKKEKIVEELF